jgi:hypothetical protein
MTVDTLQALTMRTVDAVPSVSQPGPDPDRALTSPAAGKWAWW